MSNPVYVLDSYALLAFLRGEANAQIIQSNVIAMFFKRQLFPPKFPAKARRARPPESLRQPSTHPQRASGPFDSRWFARTTDFSAGWPNSSGCR